MKNKTTFNHLSSCMFIFLVLGAVIGAVSVIFFMQNTVPVTVTLLAWQIEGLLGIILALAFAGGVLMTSLFSIPSLITDWIDSARQRKRIRQLEEELAEAKKREEAAKVTTVHTHTDANHMEHNHNHSTHI